MLAWIFISIAICIIQDKVFVSCILAYLRCIRYYDRLLAPFILSPITNYRKEANNEGRISKQEELAKTR